MGCGTRLGVRNATREENSVTEIPPREGLALVGVPPSVHGYAVAFGEVAIVLSSRIVLKIATGSEAAVMKSNMEEAQLSKINGEVCGCVWKSGLVMTKLLSVDPSWVQRKRVIELGCGTGISGLAAGALGAEEVTLTDKRTFIAEYNLRRNFSTLADAEHKFHIQTLSWGDAEAIAATQPPFDLIIGSDVMYCPTTFPELADTIVRLSGPGSVVLMATPWWPQEGTVEKHGFEDPLRKHGFTIKNISGKLPAVEIIDEVGQDGRGRIRVIEMRRSNTPQL